MKIIWGIIFIIVTIGSVFKLETVYRGILEWRGWAVFGRVSYCAYLVHVSIVRYSVATHTSLLHSGFFQILLSYLGLLFMTFVVAFPCWMLLEAPVNQLVKVCFYPSEQKETKTELVATPTHVLDITNK